MVPVSQESVCSERRHLHSKWMRVRITGSPPLRKIRKVSWESVALL